MVTIVTRQLVVIIGRVVVVVIRLVVIIVVTVVLGLPPSLHPLASWVLA
jgi:hypothetical protein